MEKRKLSSLAKAYADLNVVIQMRSQHLKGKNKKYNETVMFWFLARSGLKAALKNASITKQARHENESTCVHTYRGEKASSQCHPWKKIH